MKTVELTIPMQCPTQGSINTYPVKTKTGKIKYNQVHAHSSEIVKFRKMVRDACKDFHEAFYVDNNEIGYILDIVCYIEKGKTVKRQMPTVLGTGDVDKLARACLDSLTKTEQNKYNPYGLYKDDAQVVKIYIKKQYVDEVNPTPITKIRVSKVIMKSSVGNDFEESSLVE